MALLKINGREHYVMADEASLVHEGKGKYRLRYDGREAQIMGGSASGGGMHDWFFYNELYYGDRWLPANSLVDAVKRAIAY